MRRTAGQAVVACALTVAILPAAAAATKSARPLAGSVGAAGAAATTGIATARIVTAIVGERTIRLRAAVLELETGRERRAGYEREKFRDWHDADGDCRDTRDEVLAQESRVSVGQACDVTTGRWYSYYDRRIDV